MSRASPSMRSIAKRLIAHEAGGSESSETRHPAGFAVFLRLSPSLMILMGKAGVRGLVSRSIALANEEIRWLRAVHVKSDGSATGLQELEAQLAPEQFLEGNIVLLAQLLGLLVTFIGDPWRCACWARSGRNCPSAISILVEEI